MSTKPIFSMDNNFHAVLSTKWGGLFNNDSKKCIRCDLFK